MADTQIKRLREDDQEQEQETIFSSEVDITKRHKSSYNQILSILDENTEEEHQETSQDLTDFFTTLQHELSSSAPLPELIIESDQTVKEAGYDDKEMVIRHLLEASDDELGIPNRVADGNGGDDEVPTGEDGGFPVALSDGLWELDDDAANYYTLFPSEVIM
ncbi:unnamed protein product [Lactuca saligna]|uniref:Uncharacterized protein n=1 Tax=Lactuca saligna TaxID=75948 RepID=A0AA35YKT3_LACSI|nr:unnamed protein product [Lactuca saligna]